MQASLTLLVIHGRPAQAHTLRKEFRMQPEQFDIDKEKLKAEQDFKDLTPEQKRKAIADWRRSHRLANQERQERVTACASMGISMKRYRKLHKRALRAQKELAS